MAPRMEPRIHVSRIDIGDRPDLAARYDRGAFLARLRRMIQERGNANEGQHRQFRLDRGNREYG